MPEQKNARAKALKHNTYDSNIGVQVILYINREVPYYYKES